MSDVNVVRARIEKTAALTRLSEQPVMGMAEQIEFFADIDELLKQHAKAKHPGLSAEGAFRKEYEHGDAQFRSVVQKSRELQQELADS